MSMQYSSYLAMQVGGLFQGGLAAAHALRSIRLRLFQLALLLRQRLQLRLRGSHSRNERYRLEGFVARFRTWGRNAPPLRQVAAAAPPAPPAAPTRIEPGVRDPIILAPTRALSAGVGGGSSLSCRNPVPPITLPTSSPAAARPGARHRAQPPRLSPPRLPAPPPAARTPAAPAAARSADPPPRHGPPPPPRRPCIECRVPCTVI